MKQTEKVNGWSNDRHANASTRESLRTLRQSAVETSKSTANMATSREGWWKIARGTGKVAAATAVIGFEVLRNLLQETDSHDPSSDSQDTPYGAVPDHPLNNPHAGIYYDLMGNSMDQAGFYHDDDS